MVLAGPGLPPLNAVLFGTLGIALVAGAAAAINCLVEQKIDALMARTRGRPLPRGELSSLQTLAFASRRRHGRPVRPLPRGQRADDVAHAGDLRRLRHRLYRAAQAGDPAEHRHRRRGRGDAAGARLGRSRQRRGAAGAAAVSDHLRLDAAAFLVAGALSHQGLRRGGPADAAGDARPRIHEADDRALHRGTVRGDPASLRRAHERRALPALRGGCSAPCSSRTRCGLYRHYSDALARRTFRFSIVYLAALFSALLLDHFWH